MGCKTCVPLIQKHVAKERYLVAQAELKFVLYVALAVLMLSCHAEAYDPLDPNGNITVKWDVMSCTPDGYVAVVTINNELWVDNRMDVGEERSNMVNGGSTENCSKFKGNVPHCCKKVPTVVDLLPELGELLSHRAYLQANKKCI